MILKQARSLFILTTMLTVSVCASAKSIYVSTSGSNSNNGTTPATALGTIAAASNLAAPGDTVYLLPGQYSEAIVPVASGTASQPITYQSYGPTPAVISNVKVGILISSKAYIVVNGINVNGGVAAPNATVGTFVVVQNSNNIIIQHGSFQYANGWSGIDISGRYTANGTYYGLAPAASVIDGTTSYVTIEDNTIDNVGDFTANKGDAIQVRFATIQHILIQRNTLTHGGHDLLDLWSDYSVIQDNTFNNTYVDLFGGNAGYRSFELVGSYEVFQRNFVAHSGMSGNGRIPPLGSPRGNQNIVRLNLLADGIKEGFNTWCGDNSETVQNLRIYNNTLYGLGSGAWIVWAYTDCETLGYGAFVNNLVVNSRMTPGTIANASTGGTLPDTDLMFSVLGGSGLVNVGLGPTAQSVTKGNLFAPNGGGAAYVVLSGADGRIPLKAAAAKYPQLFTGNVEARPIFVSANPNVPADFQQQPNSPGLSAGAFLTNVVGSGTSTQLVVQDSYYFSDGNNVIPGDIIQLQGTTQTAQIVSINRTSNTLTLSSGITFKDGQGVALAYNGTLPDIGASPLTTTSSAATAARPRSPGNLSAQ